MDNAYNYALSLLAKREHARAELIDKLTKKGYLEETILEVLNKLTSCNLQCEKRYAEMLCRTRIKQGYGPLRIKQELNYKDVAADIINEILAAEHENWVTYALEVWHKKYKRQDNYSEKEVQKQKRHLYSRGYSTDTIAMVFECLT